MSNSFHEAFNIFLAKGQFKLSDSKLSLNQLQTIQSHLKTYPIPKTDSFYKIDLNNVELVLFYIEELVLPKRDDKILSGPLTEEELPSILNGRLGLHYRSNASLYNYLDNLQKQEDFRVVEYDLAIKEIENTFFSFFQLAQWDFIELENVRIARRGGSPYLSVRFDAFSSYADQILWLILKRMPLDNGEALSHFLKKASRLVRLQLEDIPRENAEYPKAPNGFVRHLCTALMNHPSLKELDLGNMILNEEDYTAFSELLKHNYHFDEIRLKNPCPYSDQLHQQFIEQMRGRAHKSSLERFQEKLLTPHNLYQLAKLSLEIKFYPLALSLNPDSKKIIIHPIYQSLPNNFRKKLPEELREYPDYLQQSFPIELDLHQYLDNQTLGAHLLEKAFQLKNSEFIRLLLSAGADLLEQAPGQLSLIGQIFSDKDNDCKKVMVNYCCKNDLKFFVPQLWHFYTSHREISNKLVSVKNHLDDFLVKLLNIDQLPFLLKIFRGVGLNGKKENWEKGFRLIIQAAQAGTKDSPISDSALEQFQQVINLLLIEVDKAKRQWFGDYQFNEVLSAELNQLLGFTQAYRKQFQLEEEKSKLKEQVKILQEAMVKIKRDKAKTEAKYIKDLADQKAEFNATRAKDRAEIRTEIREDSDARLEQYKAESDAKMKKIMDLLKQRPTSSSSASDADMPESSPVRFFKH